MSETLKIAYLLEDTPLFGGVKIVLCQANLMHRRGHHALVVSPGARPSWFDLEAEYVTTNGLEPHEIPTADVTVASYWTTIRRAMACKGEAAHYCQGFEASYTHNEAEHPAILAAYAQPLPGLTVASHLTDLLHQRFGRPARLIPQPLSSAWKPENRTEPRSTPRVLVTSPFEIDWKGVATSLEAVRLLRAEGLDCTLVRLSQWPQCDAERAILDADEYHEHIAPSEVPPLVRSCDLLLAASWEQEGFGLPVLEAMASGVPVVATDISSFRDFAEPAATLVAVRDPGALATAARAALTDTDRWRAMHREGLRIAARFEEGRVAEVAEEALRWVARGAWRDSR